MLEYYVYVILNPLKPGYFDYEKYHFDYEPFYIGKGKGRRKMDSLKEKRNKFKKNIIDKIKNSGLNPIQIILENDLDEETSFEIEKKLIKLIGRRDTGTGTLTNFTNGGEGTSGIIQSEETILKRKKSLLPYRSYFKSDDFKKRMSKIANERKNNPEYKKYCEELSKKYRGDGNPMYGKSTNEVQKESVRKAHLEGKVILTEDGRNRIIESGKKRKGIKNSVKRTDSKVFNLLSPNNELFIIFGSVELQRFCKNNKIQFHVIKNNIGKITSDMVIGKKIFAKNTIGWTRKD